MKNDPEAIYMIRILNNQMNSIQQMRIDLQENNLNFQSELFKVQEEGFLRQIFDLSERIRLLSQ